MPCFICNASMVVLPGWMSAPGYGQETNNNKQLVKLCQSGRDQRVSYVSLLSKLKRGTITPWL
uniref:Uncharacterized protein n=1 Tax=Aegilops tauschii subsp. strangulata TaxID=200361 RepID=A0A452ZQ88_AEGTS